jgi:drug/metabolite transporter (DMT)-like permease
MNFRDTIQLLVLGALWGASFLFMRVAAPEFTPIPLIALRVGIAAIVLSVFVALRGGFAPIRKNFGALTFVGAANSAIPFSLFAYATLSLTAGFSAVLNATVPLFGAVIAVLWLRQRLENAKIVGLVVGFAGVVILVRHKLSFDAEGLAIGAGITAAILYSIVGYYTKHRLSGVDPLAISAGSQIASTLLIAIPAIALWPEQTPTARAWGAAVALGVACTALAYLLYFRLLASVGPAKAMIVTYLIPAFGIAWGALFLSEPITIDMLIGGLVILVGTTIVARSATIPRPTPQPKPQPDPSLTTTR